jgi:hypothetical protein
MREKEETRNKFLSIRLPINICRNRRIEVLKFAKWNLN